MASSSQNNPSGAPMVTPPTPPTWPERVAQMVSDVVRSGLMILFWAVVAAAGVAGTYVAIQIVLWLVGLAQHAFGFGGF